MAEAWGRNSPQGPVTAYTHFPRSAVALHGKRSDINSDSVPSCSVKYRGGGGGDENYDAPVLDRVSLALTPSADHDFLLALLLRLLFCASLTCGDQPTNAVATCSTLDAFRLTA